MEIKEEFIEKFTFLIQSMESLSKEYNISKGINFELSNGKLFGEINLDDLLKIKLNK